MVPLHRRITFAAAALLGRGGGGCAAFRAFVHTTKNVRHITIIPSPRTHIITSLNYESSYTTNNSPRSCRLSSSLIMMLSTVVDQSDDTLEVSTAMYDSSDDEDEDENDLDDDQDLDFVVEEEEE